LSSPLIGNQYANTEPLPTPPSSPRPQVLGRALSDADIIIDTIKDILFDLKEPDLIPLRKQYVLKDRIFYDENGKIYVPEDQALRLDILKLHHDTPIAGHPWERKDTRTCAKKLHLAWNEYIRQRVHKQM
jgi:hypothetical protein